MMDKGYHRLFNGWASDRFIMAYDKEVKDYYVKDNYTGLKYYRDDPPYHQALITLLNDRQGYINYILDTIKSKIKETEDSPSKKEVLNELYGRIRQYKEIWE